ncbi:MAG: GMC family oxidoreductase N-terminal domain-containing protein [Rubrivivax sp.]|jgi:choline dehydrogenase-like flavoprotein|nr:GMC family oxidoreductase N-terminal domain-containing protein [Rubrivivax sp.]
MFDYLIVGGGAAGCVLAARLSEDPAVSVCLLEAGPPDRSALVHCPAGFALLARLGNINWGFETVPQPGLLGRRGYQPRGKVLGGSASVNAMIYIRGQREDYEHWAAEGNPGWGWDDVLPYFRRAEHNERGADALHATGGPLNVADLQQPNRFSALFVEAALQDGLPRNDDFNGPTQEGAGLYQVMQKGGERCSPAKGYLTPHLGRRPNLRVLTDARVRRVRFDGRRATGVEVVQGAATRTLEARREVVLCAGALQSPQILQLSGVGDGAMLQALGVPVVHHLPGVGEHLHDHVDVTVVHRADGRTELFGLSLPGALNALQGVLQWRRERRGILTTNFGEAGAFLRSRPDEPTPDLQLHFVIAKLLDHGRKTVLGHGYSCHVCVLRPESRGRVTLASANPDAAPAIDPGFLAAPGDLERLVVGIRRVRSILGRPALAGLGGRELAGSAAARADEEIERFVRSHADTIYHPVGSCRMGPGPRDVVDAQLRVHGLEGLRVVDASIMPRIVSGNTTAPTVMIAERAADLVRAAARAA